MYILLVDSDPVALAQSADALRRRYPGAEITSTTDAMEAVRYSLNHPVDAVYTEVLMPRCSGLDVIRLVQKFHPAARAYILSDTDAFADWVRERRGGQHLFKHSVWSREKPDAAWRCILGKRKARGVEKEDAGRELDEGELARVTGAGGPGGFVCPKCGGVEYGVFYKRDPGGRQISYRRCKNCRNETLER